MRLEQKDYSKVANAFLWLKQVFADESNWTRGKMYEYKEEDVFQEAVPVKCCLIGGVFLASRDTACRADMMSILRATPTGQNWPGIAKMNDDGGPEEVRKAIDQAIALAR